MWFNKQNNKQINNSSSDSSAQKTIATDTALKPGAYPGQNLSEGYSVEYDPKFNLYNNNSEFDSNNVNQNLQNPAVAEAMENADNSFNFQDLNPNQISDSNYANNTFFKQESDTSNSSNRDISNVFSQENQSFRAAKTANTADYSQSLSNPTTGGANNPTGENNYSQINNFKQNENIEFKPVAEVFNSNSQYKINSFSNQSEEIDFNSSDFQNPTTDTENSNNPDLDFINNLVVATSSVSVSNLPEGAKAIVIEKSVNIFKDYITKYISVKYGQNENEKLKTGQTSPNIFNEAFQSFLCFLAQNQPI
jgi:hypothetical protein